MLSKFDIQEVQGQKMMPAVMLLDISGTITPSSYIGRVVDHSDGTQSVIDNST